MLNLRLLGCLLVLAMPMLSCTRPAASPQKTMEYATLLKVEDGKVISICPFDSSQDTLTVDKPLGKIICMSTSHIAFLDAIGCDSVICGVSGAGYISSEQMRKRLDAGSVPDVGYDQAPDYEKILALQPDVLLAYKVSAAESPFLAKLKSLGVRVFTLYEFLENHPLGRTEYLKAFGLMTGREAQADSLFQDIAARYNAIAVQPSEDHPKAVGRNFRTSDGTPEATPSDTPEWNDHPNGHRPSYFCPEGGAFHPAKVLMNIPYGDIWYVPGAESYMSKLVKDAGGEILGAREGETESRAISLEEAFVLAQEADFWLNVGWCRTRTDLNAANPLFKDFKIQHIYNNIRRTSPGGGNDFWESGYLRPDLILQDLRAIFTSDSTTALTYYLPVD